MKILKIFGVVIAVHAVAFIFLANPGCNSSGNKAPQSPEMTATGEAPDITAADGGTQPMLGDGIISAAPEAAPAPFRAAPTRPAGDYPTPGASTYRSGGSTVSTGGGLISDPDPIVIAPTKTYKVAKGDSLWSIAKKNGITVRELAEANGLTTKSQLKIGQSILVPSKSIAVSDNAGLLSEADNDEYVTYTVKPGDALSRLARKHGTTVAEIQRLNNMKGDQLRAGQKLKLPKVDPAKTTDRPVRVSEGPQPAKGMPAASSLTYKVQPGDSLSVIAKRHKVSQADLGTLNNISDPRKLQIGQVLRIPAGGEAPAPSQTSPSSNVPPPIPPRNEAPAPVNTTPAPVPAPVTTPAPAPQNTAPVIAPAPVDEGAPVINIDESAAPLIN